MHIELLRRLVRPADDRLLRSTFDVRRSAFDVSVPFARDHKRHRFVLADPLPLMRKVSRVSDDAVLDLELRRRRADVGDLVRHLHEFLEIQRPIVERARQPEAVFDQHRLARAVAFIHPADLRDRGVRFIDHEQEILREKIEQRERPRTRRASARWRE